VAEDGESRGPFSPAQIAQAIARGRVGPHTLVWTPGMSEWEPAGEVPRLAALFASPSPPPVAGREEPGPGR
jgi:hypothetical protein